MKRLALLCVVLMLLAACADVRAAVLWIEGEKPVRSTMNRHPWWYDQVKKDQLSGGDYISNFNQNKAGEAEYRFDAPAAGSYEFWIRANPVAASLSYKLNQGQFTPIAVDKTFDSPVNIAADGKVDLRFVAWVRVGGVNLVRGQNTITFRMDSKNSNHGSIDCFVFANEPFEPKGILKPGQLAEAARQSALANRDWFAFSPKDDVTGPDCPIDLRYLNEKFAGEGGFIACKDGQFVHSRTGEPLRFWAINGPPHDLSGDRLRKLARTLAKYGVNMVRIHGGYYDQNGVIDPKKVQQTIEIVEAMKEEGIYSHLSIYFPLWLTPKPNTPWLEGYDGKTHPFAALYFNPDFQKQYQAWWKAVLLTPSSRTGRPLIDEPAVSSVEMINEDSCFFWTFNDKIPDTQLRIMEKQFGDWAAKKYGSLDAAVARWNNLKTPRDNVAEGRLGFRGLWNVFNDKTLRDKDTTAFLLEKQRSFYANTYDFLHTVGFKGAICASNWITASQQILGPVEEYSYTVADFIDRHGYIDSNVKGQDAGWSIRQGYTYSDHSALRMEAPDPSKPKSFSSPIMDIHYDNKPSMISELAFNRPNRFRSEAPLFEAAYGALQDSGCIVQFALDSSTWSVKPNYFMQPWTAMSPATMGQFPAAALIYRKGLVSTGQTLIDLNVKVQDILDLKGVSLTHEASLDDLRKQDVPGARPVRRDRPEDVLIHYAGRTNITFTPTGGPDKRVDAAKFVDTTAQTIASSTQELKLDYGRGVLTINAAQAQGAGGNLKAAGVVELKDLSISSDLDLIHIVAVSLDGQPLSSSGRMLLQVMTEEKNGGFETEAQSPTVKRITNLGHDPWMVRQPEGTVKLKRADAAELKVRALDLAGSPVGEAGNASQITLKPSTVYYLITKQ